MAETEQYELWVSKEETIDGENRKYEPIKKVLKEMINLTKSKKHNGILILNRC